MQFIPVIIDYDESPQPVTVTMRIHAFMLARDVKGVMDKATGMSLNMDLQASLVRVVTTDRPMTASLLTGQTRNSSSAWWEARQILIDAGLDPDHNIICVWHNANPKDSTGIAQPAPPHLWDASADPDAGGIATNGIGQVLKYGANVGTGTWFLAADQVIYCCHESGHALGRYHSPGKHAPDVLGYALESIMAYGYTHFSRGRPRRVGVPEPTYANPKLALPEELLTWRAHSAFSELPERFTPNAPSFVDDFTVVRVQDAKYALHHIDADNPDAISQARARMIRGMMWSEAGDP